LDLIAELDWKGFPPRLPQQPIFYPVTNLDYARRISIEWNLPAYAKSYFQKFDVQNAGGKRIDGLWIPAEELAKFNQHIIGKIEIIETHQ